MEHRFALPLAVDEAWELLTDLERIAPCMPGAQLEGRDGDDHVGIVKVKVGPITAQYRGTVRFLEADRTSSRAVLRASGRDTRGQGNAQADIVMSLEERDGSTHAHVATELTISGKIAQFGRGALDNVSAKLLDQFVVNLRDLIDEQPGERSVERPAARPSAGGSISLSDLVPARTVAIAGGALSVLFLVVLAARRSRRP